MECLDQYGDLSLFSGLGDSPLLYEFPALGSDGSQNCFSKLHPAIDSVEYDTDSAITSDDWMENFRKDLIDICSQPNVEVVLETTTTSSSVQRSFDVGHGLQSPTMAIQSFETKGQASREIELQEYAELLSLDLTESVTENVIAPSKPFGDEELGSFHAENLMSLLTEEDLGVLNDPILSPVSPQDVESILSVPSSPESSAIINDAVVPTEPINTTQSSSSELDFTTEDFKPKSPTNSHYDVVIGPVRSVRASRLKKYSPYKDCYTEDDAEEKASARPDRATVRVADRRERKKQQNKDAALRYRLKKKQEQNSIFDQCDALEYKNADLKDKVEGMTREVQYLKDLLVEVYQAKGLEPSPMLLSGK